MIIASKTQGPPCPHPPHPHSSHHVSPSPLLKTTLFVQFLPSSLWCKHWQLLQTLSIDTLDVLVHQLLMDGANMRQVIYSHCAVARECLSSLPSQLFFLHCPLYGWIVSTELAPRWQQFHVAPVIQQTNCIWILKIRTLEFRRSFCASVTFRPLWWFYCMMCFHFC